MKDANVVLRPDDLAEHIRQLGPEVGLVCAIPYCADTPYLASQVEASIVNGPHARMLYLASCLGQGYGVGKIMLFRRSDFLRAGGFGAISHTVGEDNALGHAFARIGLRTVFSHKSVRQDLGRRSFAEVYQRQLRWSVIRRGDAPLSFLFEPFCQATPAILPPLSRLAHRIGAIARRRRDIYALARGRKPVELRQGLEPDMGSAAGFYCARDRHADGLASRLDHKSGRLGEREFRGVDGRAVLQAPNLEERSRCGEKRGVGLRCSIY